MSSLNDLVQEALITKDIRPSTRRAYLVALGPFLELPVRELSASNLRGRLDQISNQNSRRKSVIALRACVDHPAVKALRVPEAVPRNYQLPDETTLRLSLMTTRHETRALLMAYAGLRLGEACAATTDSLQGCWLSVDKQVDELSRRLVPTKTGSGRVPLPRWLAPRVELLEDSASPKAVRKSLARAGARIGIDLNPAMLRTWYCNTLIRAGHPPNVVQQLMRHANVRTTFTHYAQAASADLAATVDSLGARDWTG